MSTINDYPSRGRVSEKRDDGVTFKPAGTTYELKLRTAASFNGPIDSPVEAHIRIQARKVYSVPSGGNFVTPIFGPPKIIQGRVVFLDERHVVVHAGATFIITLPAGDSAIDLNNGAIGIGSMVNVVALPGATFELAAQPVAQ